MVPSESKSIETSKEGKKNKKTESEVLNHKFPIDQVSENQIDNLIRTLEKDLKPKTSTADWDWQSDAFGKLNEKYNWLENPGKKYLYYHPSKLIQKTPITPDGIQKWIELWNGIIVDYLEICNTPIFSVQILRKLRPFSHLADKSLLDLFLKNLLRNHRIFKYENGIYTLTPKKEFKMALLQWIQKKIDGGILCFSQLFSPKAPFKLIPPQLGKKILQRILRKNREYRIFTRDGVQFLDLKPEK